MSGECHRSIDSSFKLYYLTLAYRHGETQVALYRYMPLCLCVQGNLATEAGAIAEFQAKLGCDDDATKQTAISAAQSALRAGVDFDLAPFLRLAGDADLGVREESVLLLDAALRHRPSTVAPIIAELWPFVCESARFCSNLVQVVDLGGMKHLVDRGIGVRKA